MECVEGCSRCCRELTFPVETSNDWAKEFGAFLEYTRPGTHLMRGGVLKILVPCVHLDDKGKCKVYDERPDICRNFYCKAIKQTHERE